MLLFRQSQKMGVFSFFHFLSGLKNEGYTVWLFEKKIKVLRKLWIL